MIHRDVHLQDHDLRLEVFKLVAQVPKGKVSTYGAIAKALGDVAASRAVGMILSADRERPFSVPCHRVIYSDGRTGWYAGMGRGADRKRDMLRCEGVRVEDGRVADLDNAVFTDLTGSSMLARLAEAQGEVSSLVSQEGDAASFERLAGLDVSYRGDEAFAAMVVLDRRGNVLEERTARCRVSFPYVPGYLGFREMRPYTAVMGEPRKDTLYMIDGHGRAHPRQAGVACQFGVVHGVAAAGVAKTILSGVMKGDSLVLNGEVAGRLVRTREDRAYFASVGHMASLDSVSDLVSSLPQDPMIRAHRLATRERKAAHAATLPC
ncbi:MAG: methylated-DNA--[protein]-cysteine S-methyltransferase [Euryarchaeota archaeon]|nr:methylated-DNA--[protein]-cysteine S-methyltransferase [Euryarchaeota archaeon]